MALLPPGGTALAVLALCNHRALTGASVKETHYSAFLAGASCSAEARIERLLLFLP